MDHRQELIQQIEKCLSENDNQTLSLLILDESPEFLKQVQKEIKNDENRQKFIEFVSKWEQQLIQRKQEIQNNDKIRKINTNFHQRNESDSQQNVVQNQIKRKKQIVLQDKFGYDFYGNVKCLFVAYGDLNPKQDSIKMMHSQLQLLFEKISVFIFEQEKTNKITQFSIKKRIANIFKQEYNFYQQITKQYKKTTKPTESNQNAIADSSSDEDSQSQIEEKASHMANNTLQQGEYFAKITKDMNQKQYEKYSECRSVNFINLSNNKSQQGILKFIKFLDPNKTGIFKPQMKIFDILSFISCRFVRKIIFQIIRQRNNGVLSILNSSITWQEIKKTGNQIMMIVENELEKIRKQQIPQQQIAKQIFLDDLQNHNFRTYFPKKYSDKSKSSLEIWNQYKIYRQMWVQRMLGQKQIDSLIKLNKVEDAEANTNYGKFILQHLNFYSTKGKNALWKKYFTQEKIVQEDAEIKQLSQPRKKRKLQSLSN